MTDRAHVTEVVKLSPANLQSFDRFTRRRCLSVKRIREAVTPRPPTLASPCTHLASTPSNEVPITRLPRRKVWLTEPPLHVLDLFEYSSSSSSTLYYRM